MKGTETTTDIEGRILQVSEKKLKVARKGNLDGEEKKVGELKGEGPEGVPSGESYPRRRENGPYNPLLPSIFPSSYPLPSPDPLPLPSLCLALVDATFMVFCHWDPVFAQYRLRDANQEAEFLQRQRGRHRLVTAELATCSD